jgi:hypothetical protein
MVSVCKFCIVEVNGGGTVTFDSVTFTVWHVISLYGEGNIDCNLIIEQSSAVPVSSGTDLHHIKFATSAILLYL